jgi:hypothetical protein
MPGPHWDMKKNILKGLQGDITNGRRWSAKKTAFNQPRKSDW